MKFFMSKEEEKIETCCDCCGRTLFIQESNFNPTVKYVCKSCEKRLNRFVRNNAKEHDDNR